ncbi:alpha/beta-hydrolase [Mycena polygramma]|nr:alpha/beta-hydrolase [Mycena polygramma]
MFTRHLLYKVLTAGVIASVSAQSGPIIDLGYARYQGAVSAANISQYLGIRYAAPPLGDLRFRAPHPPFNVTGVQQATAQPIQCLQASSGKSPTNPVYHPSDPAGAPVESLPVIVWIRGGGYLAGGASGNRGLVVVTIQYRLGVFGFLAGAQVKANGVLNAGLLDQDFALRWVHTNIAKFGGDPSRVTIWGESAGTGSVLQQVVANNGETMPQLFRTAITSSTFLPSQYHYNDRIPESCTAAADIMTCLRSADASTLKAANTQINDEGFFGTFLFVPVVDGAFITQRPTLSMLQGKVNGGALLSVTNTFEGTDFTQYALDLFPGFGPAQADSVGSLYAGLGSLSIFICPTYHLLNAFRRRSFKDKFAIPPGLHGSDVAYYWPSSFINTFTQSFTAFAISLDPNVKKQWNVSHTEMNFNGTDGVPAIRPVMTSDALLKRCRCGFNP